MSSEPSKWIPIALSLVAISVSGWSLWESHENRILSQDINRPILALDRIDSRTSVISDSATQEFAITLKNVAKSPASMLAADVLVQRRQNELADDCEEEQQKSGYIDESQVLQGFTYTVKHEVQYPARNCRGWGNMNGKVVLKIIYSYRGNTYSQVFVQEMGWEVKFHP